MKICKSVLKLCVYVFSDLFPVHHDSMRAVNDNDHVYHVPELSRYRRACSCDACVGMFPGVAYVNIYICATFYRSHYTPCPEKRGHNILGITLTNLGTVSYFLRESS